MPTYWLIYLPMGLAILIGYYAIKRYGNANHRLHPMSAWMVACSMFLIAVGNLLFSKVGAALIATFFTIGFASLASYKTEQYRYIKKMRENNYETT